MATKVLTASRKDPYSRRAPKLETRRTANDHFEKNCRSRAVDVGRGIARALSWNVDGSKLAFGTQDGHLSVGTVESGFRISSGFQSTNHGDEVTAVSFHPQIANVVASVSNNKTVNLWDIRSTKPASSMVTKSGNLLCTWTPCGNYLTVVGKDDKVRVIDKRTFTETEPSFSSKNAILDVIYDETGDLLFVSTFNGRIEVLNGRDLHHLQSKQVHSPGTNCNALAMTRDGSRLACGGSDSLISLWTVDDMMCERTIGRYDWPIRAISFSHDGRLLAGASEDHHIDIAWTNTGGRVYEVKHDAETFSLAWHPVHYVLAYTGAEHTSGREKPFVRIFGVHA
ncbi:unnamed protein product, partial [Mesorhabditis spiculigera]